MRPSIEFPCFRADVHGAACVCTLSFCVLSRRVHTQFECVNLRVFLYCQLCVLRELMRTGGAEICRARFESDLSVCVCDRGDAVKSYTRGSQ